MSHVCTKMSVKLRRRAFINFFINTTSIHVVYSEQMLLNYSLFRLSMVNYKLAKLCSSRFCSNYFLLPHLFLIGRSFKISVHFDVSFYFDWCDEFVNHCTWNENIGCLNAL